MTIAIDKNTHLVPIMQITLEGDFMSVQVLHGDCIEVLRSFADCSVDSIVTDPPYGLEFMGKEWDAPWKQSGTVLHDPSVVGGFQDGAGGNPFSRSRIRYGREGDAMVQFQQWFTEIAAEALRVLKPGGHLLAFGGSRTYHRLACAVEDAGFEIRDQIMWVYGSGFPKSLDVSKAIDKQAGAPVKVGKAFKVAGEYGGRDLRDPEAQGASRDEMRHTAVTDEAKQWKGWGTALKPAHEPIVVARKPLEGTVAANVLEWGTGALNIDGCRIGFQSEADERTSKDKNRHADFGTKPGGNNVYGDYSMIQRTNYDPSGRWPANFIHDGSDEVVTLFPDTGKSTGGRIGKKSMGAVTNVPAGQYEAGDPGYGDSGSAARFFYCAKASKAERNAGLGHLEPKREHDGRQDGLPGGDNPRNRTNNATQNHHPTVKPIALMRYLIRLVTPPGGIVLDPFAGSGTTLVAATLEHMNSVGIEMTDDYLPIIEGRIRWAKQNADTGTLF